MILIFGFLFALFLTQGIPLWDDDFTSWFWKIKDHSILHYFWEWLWPVSTQPEHWGFNERPAQSVLYKLGYFISGYESWSYFVIKSAIYAVVGWRIVRLAELLSGGKKKSWAARSALVAWVGVGIGALYYTAPGPVAALILHQDLAPLAALTNLLLLEWIFRSIEATPPDWQGLPNFRLPAHRAWLRKWLAISFCVYLGYKTKADVKLIGPTVGLYLLLTRARQWAFFAFPLTLMGLLAVPWGPGIFSKLPPFVPGSGGSSIGWMFQEARLSRVLSYLWSPDAFDWKSFWQAAPLSIAGVLGPFALVPALAFGVYRVQGDDAPLASWRKSATGRAWVFFGLWWCVVLAATSVLSDINFTFRIRYGILTVVPSLLLLGGLWMALAEQVRTHAWRRWLGVGLLTCLALQVGMNTIRSARYRRDLGQVMVAIDQAYERIAREYRDHRLAFMPDFRPYDYRPDAPKLFQERVTLESVGEFAKRYRPGETVTASWSASLWPELDLIAFPNGCRSGVLFDLLRPCPAGFGVAVMKWVGPLRLYEEGETLRAKGQVGQARELHERLLKEHPGNSATKFVIGLESFVLRDPRRAREVFGELEGPFFQNNAVIYNAALARMGVGEFGRAAELLETVLEREPGNSSARMNLQEVYRQFPDGKNARALGVD